MLVVEIAIDLKVQMNSLTLWTRVASVPDLTNRLAPIDSGTGVDICWNAFALKMSID